jgi:hypothetical protein
VKQKTLSRETGQPPFWSPANGGTFELATAGFARLISLAKGMAFAVEGIIVTHAEDARCWRNARCAGGPDRTWKRCRGGAWW